MSQPNTVGNRVTPGPRTDPDDNGLGEQIEAVRISSAARSEAEIMAQQARIDLQP